METIIMVEVSVVLYLLYNKIKNYYYYDMRTLNVAISDIEYNKFGLKNNVLSFSDFIDIISKELMKKNLETAVETAEKYGLSSMSMEAITAEVKASRQNAKSNN